MKRILAAALALSVTAPVFARDILLDFETVTGFASIDRHYDGGTDSAGAAGPALGVSFGGDALGLVNDAAGPYFSNAPSPIGVLAPVGPDATMNVARGFFGRISLFYSASQALDDAVRVWSGFNGTGTVLASFDLAANAQAGGCTDSPFCNFSQLTAAFDGRAYSVTFGDAVGAAIDNVAITALPEPGTALLLSLGAAGLVASRRRR